MYRCGSEFKQQISQKKPQSRRHRKKIKNVRSASKVMVIIFFNHNGFLYKNIVQVR